MSNPRKPTNIKIVEGTFRKDRANPAEPQMEVSIPSCPSRLSPKAKAEWKRIVLILKEAGVIFKASRASLACYCEFVGQFDELCLDMTLNEQILVALDREDDNYIEGLLSLKKERRAIRREMIQIGDSIRKYANEFGITPASQGKVSSRKSDGGEKTKGKDKGRFFK